MVNWHLSKQGIRWQVLRYYIVGSHLELNQVACFFFLSLLFPKYWFSIGSQAQARLT